MCPEVYPQGCRCNLLFSEWECSIIEEFGSENNKCLVKNQGVDLEMSLHFCLNQVITTLMSHALALSLTICLGSWVHVTYL